MDYVDDLIATVTAAVSRLRRVADADAAARPAPGKWSAKEVIGHLIDSASNNHQRFVRALWQDDLMFSGYDQDAWVSAQEYQKAPWAELLELWEAFNLHPTSLDYFMRDYVAHLHHHLRQIDGMRLNVLKE